MLDPLGLFEYRVALHVHSRYSDGGGTPERIIAEARRVGLDVLWLTDHDGRWAASDPGAGYYGHLLFLVGAEITPPSNHYLVFGDVALVPPTSPLQTIIDSVRNQQGAGFIAHPDDPGNKTARLPSYRWNDRTVDGFTGLEIWNHLSDWARQIHHVPGGLWAAFHPFSGLDQACPETLALWDERGQNRRIVGIGGADAHAARVGYWPFSLTIFPYRHSFSAIRTHIYTREPLAADWHRAEQQLLEGLLQGRVAIVNAALGSETGFRLWVQRESGLAEPMGTDVAYDAQWMLRGLSPVPVAWEIFCNGQLAARQDGSLVQYKPDRPGVWRVALRRGPRRAVWIYSNPIYLR